MFGTCCRILVSFVIAVTFSLPLAPVANAEVTGCKPARQFVTRVAKKVAVVMAKPSGHRRNFARVFKRYADLKGMANFALGRHLRAMPRKLRPEYYRLAEKMVVSMFAAKMSRTKGRSFKIWNCRPKGRGYTVNGVVIEKNGDIVIDVHWLLMPRGKTLKIYDVAVAFLWMTQQQRSSFRKVLNKNRGDYSALLKYMRARSS